MQTRISSFHTLPAITLGANDTSVKLSETYLVDSFLLQISA